MAKYFATFHRDTNDEGEDWGDFECENVADAERWAKRFLRPGQHVCVWETAEADLGPVKRFACSEEFGVTEIHA